MKKENHLIIEEALQALNKKRSLKESLEESLCTDDVIFDKILETVQKNKPKDTVWLLLDTSLEDSEVKMCIAAINKTADNKYILDYYLITDPDDTIEGDDWVDELFDDTFLADIISYISKRPLEIYNILKRNMRRDSYVLSSNEDPTVNVLIEHHEETDTASVIVYKYLKEILPEEFLHYIELYESDKDRFGIRFYGDGAYY